MHSIFMYVLACVHRRVHMRGLFMHYSCTTNQIKIFWFCSWWTRPIMLSSHSTIVPCNNTASSSVLLQKEKIKNGATFWDYYCSEAAQCNILCKLISGGCSTTLVGAWFTDGTLLWNCFMTNMISTCKMLFCLIQLKKLVYSLCFVHLLNYVCIQGNIQFAFLMIFSGMVFFVKAEVSFPYDWLNVKLRY